MNRPSIITTLSALALVLLCAGCSSMKTPATANVAVTKNAVDNASDAGAAEFAPAEMKSARDKMGLANKAMADGDYKLANDLAIQAQADAKLAQSKATSAKAQAAAKELNNDIQVLQDELNRKNNQ
ncbi:DUF4398 domain-containing protein [Sapientia aquatica]|uniref:DUF4398 domain-containing protein n=1 Tax=Sapientia aquatica TaxID=1549640 RepID=A0A4R5W381_9BURK|nr:DUF4398 domain-containing protein [Sapientia aquatica]TDK67111.1 DUF4398 domain-containing protein [Sapientia aquatica]